MSRNAKKDENHDDVVEALQKAAFLVEDVHTAGDGVLDLIVGNPDTRRLMLMEIKKSPDRPSDIRFTLKQKAFLKKWAGYPVRVVYSPSDAVATATRELGPPPRNIPDETPAEKLRRLATSATRAGGST